MLSVWVFTSAVTCQVPGLTSHYFTLNPFFIVSAIALMPLSDWLAKGSNIYLILSVWVFNQQIIEWCVSSLLYYESWDQNRRKKRGNGWKYFFGWINKHARRESSENKLKSVFELESHAWFVCSIRICSFHSWSVNLVQNMKMRRNSGSVPVLLVLICRLSLLQGVKCGHWTFVVSHDRFFCLHWLIHDWKGWYVPCLFVYTRTAHGQQLSSHYDLSLLS